MPDFTQCNSTYVTLKTFSESGIIVQVPFFGCHVQAGNVDYISHRPGYDGTRPVAQSGWSVGGTGAKIAITVLIIVMLGNTVVSFDTVVSKLLTAGLVSLVLTVAMAILSMPDYSVTALVYGLFMKITALSFLVVSKRILARDEAAQVAESPT